MGKGFSVPLKHLQNGNITIVGIDINQRYIKAPFVDVNLEKYFKNLKPVKVLSEDKVTITFTVKQGNLDTEIFMLYVNNDEKHGDYVCTLNDAIGRFCGKMGIKDKTEDLVFVQNVMVNISNINKLKDLFNDYYIGREFYLNITNPIKGYCTFTDLGGL